MLAVQQKPVWHAPTQVVARPAVSQSVSSCTQRGNWSASPVSVFVKHSLCLLSTFCEQTTLDGVS